MKKTTKKLSLNKNVVTTLGNVFGGIKTVTDSPTGCALTCVRCYESVNYSHCTGCGTH